MPHHCSAPNCSSRDTKENRERDRSKRISFHRFPNKVKNNEQWKNWANACKREDLATKINWEPRSIHAFLCSKHFLSSDFEVGGPCGPRRLRENTVPSIFTFPDHLTKPATKPRISRTSTRTRSDVADSEACTSQTGINPICADQPDINNSCNNVVEQKNGLLKQKMAVAVKREYSPDPEEIFEEMTIEYDHPIKQEPSQSLVLKKEEEIENEDGEGTRGNNKERRNGNDEECETFDPSSINHHPTTSCRSGNDKNRPKCSICKKTFSSNRNMKLHMDTVHSGLKPHKCSICEKSFNKKGNLNRHMRIHSGLKPHHKYSICNKSFTEKGNLEQHTNTVHSGLKPHKCSICEKSFSLMEYLRIHMKIHNYSGLKPKCSICKKEYSDLTNLKIHMDTVHSGLKPHKCGICQKSFTEKGTMMMHMNAVHISELKPYKCSICEKYFTLDNLRVHMKVHCN